MSDQYPPGEEPTRIGGSPDPQQPYSPQPGQWAPPSQPNQQPQWGPPNQASQPNQPQWGPPNQAAQQPQWGPPNQPNQYGQPQWGAPQQPGGYGGAGNWGPPGGPGAPGGNGPSKGLIIGIVVAVLVLIGGGIGAAVAFGGDDNDDKSAKDDSSATADPTDEPTEALTDLPGIATVSPEPSDSPSADSPSATGSFTAEYFPDVKQVCTGAGMTNAAPFDKATAKVMGFLESPKDPEWGGHVSVGINEPFELLVSEYEKVSMVVCMTGAPSAEAKPITCQSEDDKGKKISYTFAPYDYVPVFREATTGQVLHEGEKIGPPFTDCPMFAFIDEDGEYTPSPDSEKLDEQIALFLKS